MVCDYDFIFPSQPNPSVFSFSKTGTNLFFYKNDGKGIWFCLIKQNLFGLIPNWRGSDREIDENCEKIEEMKKSLDKIKFRDLKNIN